jgi:hypothetical protein
MNMTRQDIIEGLEQMLSEETTPNYIVALREAIDALKEPVSLFTETVTTTTTTVDDTYNADARALAAALVGTGQFAGVGFNVDLVKEARWYADELRRQRESNE